MARYKRLVAEYPLTPYGQYARYFLGRSLLRRNATLEQGVEMLQALVKDWPSFPLAQDVQYLIAQAYYDMGKRQLVEVAIQNVDWLWSLEANDFARQWTRIGDGP